MFVILQILITLHVILGARKKGHRKKGTGKKGTEKRARKKGTGKLGTGKKGTSEKLGKWAQKEKNVYNS